MQAKEEAVDVVVIGAGLAGYRAALRAASLGARTLILEKMPQPGGSSILAGGFFAFAGTRLQKQKGLEDSVELLKKDLLELGKGVNDPALVDAYSGLQLEEFEYFCRLGVDFVEVQPSSGHSVPRGHRADPKQFMALLAEEISKSPLISLCTGTPAKRLARGPGSQRIDVVHAEKDGAPLTVRAKKGIVIATGGFSRAKDLLQLFAPHVKKAIPAGCPGNEGDGIRMAWEHGAAFADLGYINGTFGTYPYPEPDELPAVIFPVYRGGIAVNTEGKRFIDESKSYKALGEAVLLQERGIAFQIFDQSVMDQSLPVVPSYNFEAMAKLGRFTSAQSITELADKLQIDRDALAETVGNYNRDTETGMDRQFGRKSLSHTYGTISPLRTPPFYAYPCTCMLSTTYGGLRVNADMQVLNIWGEALPGLYAAGEVMGGFHGESYMTGSALGKALIFGRVAADAACRS